MPLAKLAVWAGIDCFSSADAASFARRVEAWGYDALWMPEGLGREMFSSAAWLLASTTRLKIVSGIANIYARDAFSAAAAQKGLHEQSGGRFVMGLGVSHVPLVEGVRHLTYGKPVQTMRAYLQAMADSPYLAPTRSDKPLTLLAALGPLMTQLAAEKADGSHPYNTTPDHTAEARRILGPGKLLCVEQAAVLETDAVKARAAARQFLSMYLPLPNYVNAWKRMGFSDDDVAGSGSDRLVDAIVAWGDESAIRRRLDLHWQAGADQVCVQAIGPMKGMLSLPDERLLALLAPTH